MENSKLADQPQDNLVTRFASEQHVVTAVRKVLAYASELYQSQFVYLVGPEGIVADVEQIPFDAHNALSKYFLSIIREDNPAPFEIDGETQILYHFPIDSQAELHLFVLWPPQSRPEKQPGNVVESLIRNNLLHILPAKSKSAAAMFQIQALPTATALLSTEGTILEVNEAFAELLGYEAPMPVGANLFDFTPAGRKLPRWVRQPTDMERALTDGVGKIIAVGGREVPVLRQIEREACGNDGKPYIILQLINLTDIQKATVEKEKTIVEQQSVITDTDHRLQNNLQLVCSLLDYEARSFDDPLIRNVLAKSRTRVIAISLLNDFLSDTGEYKALVNFDGYLKALAHQVASVKGAKGGGIELVIEKGSLKLLPQRAQHCGLILHEILANAYDHAFPNNLNGKILVRSYADKKKNTCVFEIIDNGVGLPGTVIPETAPTTGFKLIHILLRQLNAELTYHYQDGAHFAIKFHHLKKESK